MSAGLYVENVVVRRSVRIEGEGGRTRVVPAVSSPAPCEGGALCGGAASTVFTVRASDVVIRNLTIDGDNPALTSGITRNGADIDARNGIVVDDAGDFSDLEVEKVTLRNLYGRGVQANDGTHNEVVFSRFENIGGDPSSIAILFYTAGGLVAFNRIEDANDAIALNHSLGTVVRLNTVRRSAAGVHSDNAGDGGGVPDRIENNFVSDCTDGGYGAFVFVPYVPPVVRNNTIRGCYVGLAAFGQGVEGDVLFEGNYVGVGEEEDAIGFYASTHEPGYGDSDVDATVTGNVFDGTRYGAFIETPGAGLTIDAAFSCNRFDGNYVGLGVPSTEGAAHANAFEGTSFAIDARRIGTGTYDATGNYWGCAEGPGGAGCGAVLGPVDTSLASSEAPACAF